MLKQEVKPFKLGRMPALLIIDKNGIIKYIGLPKELNEPIEGGPLDSDVIIEGIKKLNSWKIDYNYMRWFLLPN